MMNLEEYSVRVNEFKRSALALNQSTSDYQRFLDLNIKALVFFGTHSKSSESDFQYKLEILADFFQLIDKLKSNGIKNSQNETGFFFKKKEERLLSPVEKESIKVLTP